MDIRIYFFYQSWYQRESKISCLITRAAVEGKAQMDGKSKLDLSNGSQRSILMRKEESIEERVAVFKQ